MNLPGWHLHKTAESFDQVHRPENALMVMLKAKQKARAHRNLYHHI